MKYGSCSLFLLIAALGLGNASAQQVSPPYVMFQGSGQQGNEPANPQSANAQNPPLSGQQQGVVKDLYDHASSYPGQDPNALPPPDVSVSVRQAAVECAVAQRVEQMGRENQMPGNIIDSIFKSGDCSGKVQTFMLVAQAQYPGCFPKFSLEEAIGIFVKWAASHNEAGSENYVAGMNAAFGEIVPCMKK